MGDLNISFEHPCNEREEAIANLLDKINLVDSSRKFCLRQCSVSQEEVDMAAEADGDMASLPA